MSEDPRDRRSWSAHYPGWAPLATPIRFDVRIWLRGCRLRSSPSSTGLRAAGDYNGPACPRACRRGGAQPRGQHRRDKHRGPGVRPTVLRRHGAGPWRGGVCLDPGASIEAAVPLTLPGTRWRREVHGFRHRARGRRPDSWTPAPGPQRAKRGGPPCVGTPFLPLPRRRRGAQATRERGDQRARLVPADRAGRQAGRGRCVVRRSRRVALHAVLHRARRSARATLGYGLHRDGTARLQTVGRDDDAFMRQLLACYQERTGAAVLLNAALNRRGEPLADLLEHTIAIAAATTWP